MCMWTVIGMNRPTWAFGHQLVVAVTQAYFLGVHVGVMRMDYKRPVGPRVLYRTP